MDLVLPRVIGHRGAAAHAPENTLAGLRRAAEMGATWVEFDVMLSADGVALLHHDHDLKRTAGRPEAIAALSYAQLHDLDVGAWFAPAYAGEAPPSLEAAIALLGELGLGANVEIKPAEGRERETAQATVAVLRRCWPASLPTPLLSSFSRDALAAAAAAAPELPRGLLQEGLSGDGLACAAALGCVSVNLDQAELSEATVAAVRAAGYRLLSYTVNEPETARRLRRWGVDSLITDRPGELIAALG
jgi:glycerophosphoryl diester phosphodiesterase